MKLDLSGILSGEAAKLKREYDAAVNSGDETLAGEKASQLSSIYRNLSENNSHGRDRYHTASDFWKEVSKKPSPMGKKKGDSGVCHPKVQSQGGEEEFNERIESCITESPVKWKDIGGLSDVKRLLMETVAIAGLKKPSSVKPWKGVLLFGPPGTGKTLLASAAAGTLGATFYDVKSGSILSKYFGESSKIISELYNSAKVNSPSIVFFDEFDSLSRSRSEGTTDASLKVLSGILTALDGLSGKMDDRLVLTLAATNTPWDLDRAVLSRFPRRIYVTLPDSVSAEEIISIHTADIGTGSVTLHDMADMCVSNHYSGRDIQSLCQQAIWNMVHEQNPELFRLAELSYNELNKRSLKIRPLEKNDFMAAFEKIKSPVTSDDLEAYESWNLEFGEV